MTKAESETDKSLTKLVSDEIRKLSDQVSTNAQIMDKRIGMVQAEINVDRLQRLIDKKMSKEEAMIKFEGFELRVNRIEKVLKQNDVKFS